MSEERDPLLIGTVETDFGRCRVEFTGLYTEDGTKAVELTDCDDGSPVCKLTVCIPGTELAKDEVLVKTWEENVHCASVCLKYGLFEDTGKRVPTGYVEAQIWKVVQR